MLRQRERVRTGGPEAGTEIYHYGGGSDSPAWIDEGEGQWSRFIGGVGASAIEKSATEEVTLQLADMHGDVVATADTDPEATELLSTQQFDEYGNPKQEATPKLGWLGSKLRRTELPSGVIQMGVRSYVPAMGRFLTPDPISGGSANAYDYANGDPVNQFDLTGECPGMYRDCMEKQIRRHKRRARRKARRHRLRRLAQAGRHHARASSVSSDAWRALGGLLNQDVGDQAGKAAGKAAAWAFNKLKAEAVKDFKDASEMVRYTMRAARAAGGWAWAHRRQIASCAKGAADIGVKLAPLATSPVPGSRFALGLSMAVGCGAALAP